jgi:hypothetical protein
VVVELVEVVVATVVVRLVVAVDVDVAGLTSVDDVEVGSLRLAVFPHPVTTTITTPTATNARLTIRRYGWRSSRRQSRKSPSDRPTNRLGSDQGRLSLPGWTRRADHWIMTGLLVALWPTRRASRIQPAAALRLAD